MFEMLLEQSKFVVAIATECRTSALNSVRISEHDTNRTDVWHAATNPGGYVSSAIIAGLTVGLIQQRYTQFWDVAAPCNNLGAPDAGVGAAGCNNRGPPSVG